MEQLFLTLLEISGGTSVVILLIFLFSNLINKTYTAKWKYWLWLVLAFRLIVPVNFMLPTSPAQIDIPIPNKAIVFQSPGQNQTGEIPSPHLVQNNTQAAEQPSMNSLTTVALLALIWIAGAAVFVLYQGISYAVFRRKTLRWGIRVEAAANILTAMAKQMTCTS